ncbi:MAG TPA: hypothetical protein VJ739_09680 [Gemmataceae bacterium]|nr:hypothetical protein [Gemmataceae bacterium]
MQLSEYLAQPGNSHAEQGNPHVECNALYKRRENFNCYLTASQAIECARHLLEKAQLILDNGIDDAVVQVWNKGEHNEKLYFGLTEARKGRRRNTGRLAPAVDGE